MKNKLKILISCIILSVSINTNAGILDLMKNNPELTAIGIAGGVLYSGTAMHKARDLSFHLPKVKSYFAQNPKDFNPVAKYVLWALANPSSKSDYDRYKRLAEVMNLDGIPPYYPPKINNYDRLENPIQEQNPKSNKLENPVKEQDFSNIIYTPQGKQFDTSTEFPFEEPKTWNEYLLLKENSTILGDNMANAGEIREPDTAAHHIVSATSPDSQDARDILEKYLRNTTPIGEETFNNEINGVYLPNINNQDLSIPGIRHNGRHPKNYNIKVNDKIVKADLRGGWIEVKKELENIKQSLLNADRDDKWKDMP